MPCTRWRRRRAVPPQFFSLGFGFFCFSGRSQASGSSSAAAASDQSGYKAEFTIPWGAIAAGVAAVIAVGAFLSFRRRSSAQREALDEVRGDRS